MSSKVQKYRGKELELSDFITTLSDKGNIIGFSKKVIKIDALEKQIILQYKHKLKYAKSILIDITLNESNSFF